MPEMERSGFGRLTVDGREETRNVIVLPEHIVRGWWRTQGPRSPSGTSTKCSHGARAPGQALRRLAAPRQGRPARPCGDA
jgi:hypothetical protein